MKYLVLLLLALDIVTTTYGLRHGLSERNPLMRWLMGRIGVVQALCVSHGLLAGAVLGFYGVEMHWQAMALIAAIYALVVANNVRSILSTR